MPGHAGIQAGKSQAMRRSLEGSFGGGAVAIHGGDQESGKVLIRSWQAPGGSPGQVAALPVG